MTRQEFADLTKLTMGIQNQDARASFDDRVIWRVGDIVRGKLILDYINITQSKGEFVKGTVVPVENDTIRNRKYIIIGGVVLNMPDNAGFVSISQTQGDDTPITITNAGQIGIYANLEASEIGTTAWQEGGRIYFEQLSPLVNNILVIGIPTMAALEDNEQVPIPFGVEDEWMRQTKLHLTGQLPEDKQNDNRQSVD